MIATEAPHPNFDGPDTPPHTDCLEDNDDYSSSDSSEIIEESALEHFSAVLQEAQRLAVQAEKARNERNQRPKRYTGKSATTMYLLRFPSPSRPLAYDTMVDSYRTFGLLTRL